MHCFSCNTHATTLLICSHFKFHLRENRKNRQFEQILNAQEIQRRRSVDKRFGEAETKVTLCFSLDYKTKTGVEEKHCGVWFQCMSLTCWYIQRAARSLWLGQHGAVLLRGDWSRWRCENLRIGNTWRLFCWKRCSSHLHVHPNPSRLGETYGKESRQTGKPSLCTDTHYDMKRRGRNSKKVKENTTYNLNAVVEGRGLNIHSMCERWGHERGHETLHLQTGGN